MSAEAPETKKPEDEMQDVVGQKVLWLLWIMNMETETEKRKEIASKFADWVREFKRKADLYDALPVEVKEASNDTGQG